MDTSLKLKYIGALSTGVMSLVRDDPRLLHRIIRAFKKAATASSNWFYRFEVSGQTLFACDSGDGYTVMLPEEY